METSRCLAMGTACGCWPPAGWTSHRRVAAPSASPPARFPCWAMSARRRSFGCGTRPPRAGDHVAPTSRRRETGRVVRLAPRADGCMRLGPPRVSTAAARFRIPDGDDAAYEGYPPPLGRSIGRHPKAGRPWGVPGAQTTVVVADDHPLYLRALVEAIRGRP